MGNGTSFSTAGVGKLPVTIHTIRDRSLGIDGKFRDVFVQQKPH